MSRIKSGLIERLCLYLGRHNFISGLLDYFTFFLFPLPQFALSGAGGEAALSRKSETSSGILDRLKPVFMARPLTEADNYKGLAPMKPKHKHGFDDPVPPKPPGVDTGGIGGFLNRISSMIYPALLQNYKQSDQIAKDSQKHSSAACDEPKYHGMHGRPCKFAGGTDNKCPRGSVSGWFWSYEVPQVGRVYYVDCCGGVSASDVWCQWTSEYDWCIGQGRAASRGVAGYTCTLAILEKDMKVSNAGSHYEVSGVDP